MNNFQNKIVWITGASSGIGEALSYQFAKEGAKLVLSARREMELQRVANATGLGADKVLVLPMDMLNFDVFPEKVKTVLEHFGQIDVVVQNAGITQRSLVKDTDFKVYRDIMELDFFSTVAFTQAILPHFSERKTGHFVAISSVAGKIGTPLRSGYCAAKHAMIAFFDSLRAEVWQENIQVTVICPGYINTPISLNALDGNGNVHGKMDKNQSRGMSAERCAEKIVKAVKANQKEVYIGGWYEVMGVYLKRYLPAVVYKLVLKVNAEK
ncbi:SDR family oxidoreductase [Arcicella rosea]|uniref:Short-subunit dehydrogenase n=1 Tax=Arcicella rosea TaxID=502909 RepID=A0A841EUQ3_9BACT|nr:SDR family oxidoreductase [Arcicella rosea]MBB6004030.1 short-subunit dehydrogenase [Arcicella rosea]